MREDSEPTRSPGPPGGACEAGPRSRLMLAVASRRVVVHDAGGAVGTVRGLAALDAAARSQLAAQRSGAQHLVRGADEELRWLVRLAGLADVLTLEPTVPTLPVPRGDAAEPDARAPGSAES